MLYYPYFYGEDHTVENLQIVTINMKIVKFSKTQSQMSLKQYTDVNNWIKYL